MSPKHVHVPPIGVGSTLTGKTAANPWRNPVGAERASAWGDGDLEVLPTQYTDGIEPWFLGQWRMPRGAGEISSVTAIERSISVSPTILASSLPVVYGTAKVTGYCGFLEKNGNGSWAVALFFFCHGEVDDLGTIEFNGKDITAYNSTDDPWFGSYQTFNGESTGIIDPPYGTTRDALDAMGCYRTYPGLAGVMLTIRLGEMNVPGTLSVNATPTGKIISKFAGGTGPSSNPIDIAQDIVTDTEQWRGLGAAAFASGDWSWIASMCDDDAVGDTVKRFEFNGAVSVRNGNAALREVLRHCSCSVFLSDKKFQPALEWRPKPIAGTIDDVSSTNAVVGSGTNFTNLAVGDRIYLDHVASPHTNKLFTITAITDATNMTIDTTIDLTTVGTTYTARCRPISQTYIQKENWVTSPHGSDLPVGAIPDVLVVNHKEEGTFASVVTRCEDPDGYTAANVKRVEATYTGVNKSAQAARLGHITRRVMDLSPFTWQGAASAESGAADLRPGDIFVFDTKGGLSDQAAVVQRIELRADGTYFMIFREYDYGCYADDNADDDTPVWDETAGDPDPPATPTGLTQRFVYSGPWQGESLWGASVSWTLSNMNKSAYSLIMDYDVFEPTSTAATATTETVDLTAGVILPLVPSQLLFTCLYRFADNATAGETGTFQDSATVTIDYLADNADPPTTVRQTWTVDLDDSDDNDWHLLSIRLAADTSEQYHAIRLNIDGDTKNLHHIAIGYPFLNVAGQLSNASIGVNYTFSEGAGASDTVNQYRITGIQPGGERVTVATAPQGSTEIEATIVSGAGNGTRPGGTSSIFSFQNYILQSASFGGLTATGSKDIYSDNRATFYPNSSPVIDQAALDWDPTNIAASYVPSVGSDGLTKEYKDVGLIPVGAEAISTTTSAVMTNARHRVTASGITVTIPDGTVTEEKHEFKVQSGVTWAKLTGKINSASSTTNTVYDGEAFEFVWTGTYWEQIT